MKLNYKKYNLKLLTFVMQVVTFVFVAIFLIDKQVAIEIKNTLDALNVDSNIQGIFARIYMGFKMMSSSPSLIVLFLAFLNVLCVKYVARNCFVGLNLDRSIEKISPTENEYHITESLKVPQDCYQINHRLLN